MRNSINICIALVLLLPTGIGAKNVYDSLAWFANGNLAYARVKQPQITTTYVFYENGHIAEINRSNSGGLLSQSVYYPNGKLKFDTVRTESYYNWSNSYYPDGSRKRFIQEQFASSYKSSHTKFEIIDWNEIGEVSHVFIKDDRNNVVCDEAYPFRRFHNLQWHKVFYEHGAIKESGFYSADPFSGKKKKCGAWVTFYPGGQLESIGLFMNDVPWGLHYTFDTAGTQTSLKNYELGVETTMVAGELNEIKTNWDGGSEMVWQWLNFTNEGIVKQASGPVYFYYRGCIIAEINSIRNILPNDNHVHNFGFPYMAFWSTWNKCTMTFTGDVVTRLNEEINGSWSNTFQFSKDGKLTETYFSSRTERITWYRNELKAKQEKPIYYSYEPEKYFVAKDRKRDTVYYWNESGNITRAEIHGLYGQLQKTIIIRPDRADSIVVNPLYCRVYVEVTQGRQIEIIDDELLLPGYAKVVNEKGVVVMEGMRTLSKSGLWITRDPATGIKLILENYSDGQGKGPGIYKEFYPNGNPKIKGRYNNDREKTGVWKSYNEKGRVMRRERYRNGDVRGLEYCRKCCPNRRGRYRTMFTLHIGKRSISFPKCHRRIVPYD